jgi:hypothetical protein
MVDVLALVLSHDERLVEQAIIAALEVERPSKQHVLNCLSRTTETQAVAAANGIEAGHRNPGWACRRLRKLRC